jgi:hypothetical protein
MTLRGLAAGVQAGGDEQGQDDEANESREGHGAYFI